MIRARAHLVVFLALALSCGVRTSAAAALLGLHEAQALVEHTPVFLCAIERGSCPATSDSTVNGGVATVIVRGGCMRFEWIASFYVDLTTGLVTKDGGPFGPLVIETPDLAKLRSEFFAQREQLRLTSSEAVCLLDKARIPVAEGACRRVREVREDSSVFVYSIENACARDVSAEVIVDRYSYALVESKPATSINRLLLKSSANCS